jgi:hypothetical protein
MTTTVRVKWASANTPVILVNRDDSRLYLTKTELAELGKKINDFINYYSDDFSEKRIDYIDSYDDYDDGLSYSNI